MGEALARATATAHTAGRCGICSAPAVEYAHRTARGRGGAWARNDGCALCSDCHRWCHANPWLARAGGWMVDTGTDPATVPVWMSTPEGDGWWLLGADGLRTLLDRDDVPEIPHWAADGLPSQTPGDLPRGGRNTTR